MCHFVRVRTDYCHSELFLSHLTVTCLNTGEWLALVCLTCFKDVYTIDRDAEFVHTVAEFWDVPYPKPIPYSLLLFLLSVKRVTVKKSVFLRKQDVYSSI